MLQRARARCLFHTWWTPRARESRIALLAPPQTSWSVLLPGYTLAIQPRRRRPRRAKSEFGFGAGAGIRTLDRRFKSPSRPPHEASQGLLPYSILRPAPPRGSCDSPRLAIQIGYTSEGLERSPGRRQRDRRGSPPHLAPSDD